MVQMVWVVLLVLQFLGFDVSGLAKMAQQILPMIAGGGSA